MARILFEVPASLSRETLLRILRRNHVMAEEHGDMIAVGLRDLPVVRNLLAYHGQEDVCLLCSLERAEQIAENLVGN